MKSRNTKNNVKIPEVISKYKFPWSDMHVGDSVLIRAEEGEELAWFRRSVVSSAQYYGNKTGKRFKSLFDMDTKSCRVWRIK
ncbi:hypothetical protein PITCH_A890004 [uncultured Desulfobacterium sp.]|uniref:Uncharacterized protein n=1 Tax=uncultured Desulfobacterium sp. TaxID=201089 RepID=A0A445N3L0_9BACT|nr:hypothetical protein PITCH_A890004 [uncultured Desulfobacterium sp.]